MVALTLLWPVIHPTRLSASDFYWDADSINATNNVNGTGLGGNGTWDTATVNWWPVPAGDDVAYGNGVDDRAIFIGPVGSPAPSSVNVASGIQSNRLTFLRSGYTLTGGDLTLTGTAPSIAVNYGESAVINSQINGTAGLLKTGGGTVKLTNSLNSYTGNTTISGGTVIINNASALGADSSAIVVTGSVTRGFGGGSLVLEGGYGSGVTFERSLTLQALGPIGDRGSAFQSVGDNTVTGVVSSGVNSITTRLNSLGGRLTLSGGLAVSGTTAATQSIFGAANQSGAGSYLISGPLTGSGILEKTGSGTVILSPSSSSGFSGTVRVGSSASGTISSVRIGSTNVLGTRTSLTTGSVLDLNGGTLEVRMDTPSVLAGGSNANVYHRANTSALFFDHSIGGSAINGNVPFGALAFEENVTTNFNGRNGYGATFGAASVQGGNNLSTYNNNLNGNLTFNGSFWNNLDNTGSRTLTLGGNGNTFINGNLNASAADFNHNFTKSGTGTLTITGTGSTIDGNVNIQAGTLAITDFRSLNNAINNTTISIGSGTTTGTLLVRGNDSTLDNVTSNRTIDLAGATGGATIIANQTGTSPGLVITGITSTGGVSTQEKTLTLSGTNTGSNIVNAVIPFNAATSIVSVVKADSGTWVLTATNGYSGNTTITGGKLELRANVFNSNIVPNANTFFFDTNPITQAAGGILEFRGVQDQATFELLGNFNANSGSSTVRLLGNGNSTSLRFITTATPGKGSGVNFDTSLGLNGTITLAGVATTTATTLPGNGHFYINSSDFPRSNANILAAPIYGTDAGFVNAPAALVAGNHNLVTGNITAQPARSITSLKMTNNMLNLAGLLTVNTGATSNDGGILVVGNSTISGVGGLTTGGNGTLVYRVEGLNNTLALATPMTATTTGGFTKNGAGNLVLSAANAQTGATTINEGTVRLSGNGTLSGSSAALAIRQGATLDLAGISTGLSIGAFNGNGTVTNSGGVATLTVGNGNGNGVFSGTIQNGSSTVNVTKTGTGGQTWSGLNTYTGVTTVGSTGLISVPNLTNIGQLSGIGAGNATAKAASLVFTGTTGGIAYTGLNSINTDRLFTLNGNAVNSGGQIANNSANQSALIFNNTSPIAFGPNATVPQTITLGGSSTGDSQFNPLITNNGALPTGVNKIGAGTWILKGLNTYTGNTSINQGVLIANDGTTLPNASGLLLGAAANSGVLQTNGNFTRNVATAPGPNTVTWNGAAGGGGFAGSESKLVVALGGTVAPTPLTWGAGGFVGTANPAQPLVLSSTTAVGEVEFRNDINLGGLTRTIQVDDNTNAATDFATITGAFSGTAGGNILKTGAGILQLYGSNSYVGTTSVDSGTLVVRSLGTSAVPGNSGVGSSVAANTISHAVLLGNGTTGAAVLQYVGLGETSDRLIRLNTTSAANTIASDGTGPLVLTNVLNDLVVGNKTLQLRGTNTSGNTISSNLADNTALGILTVTVDGGATWILSGANTYTGVTNANGGALGIANAGALGGNAALSMSNGIVFASGADLTLPNQVRIANATTNAFIGDYSFTASSPIASLATTGASVLTNNIAIGKSLNLNGGITSNSLTASATLTLNGTGDTIVNGTISTSTAFNFGLTYSGAVGSSLTIAGPVASGTALNNGTLTLSSGTLKLGASEVIPHGAALNNVVINPGATATARFDLRGFSETINGLTATSLGTTIIDNSAPGTNSTFAIGGSDQNSTIGGGVGGNYSIQNSGVGSTLGLTKIGSGNAAISSGVLLTYRGDTSVTGGRLDIGSPLNGTTVLSVSGAGSSLNVNGGFVDPATIKTVSVGSGATLGLVDSNANILGNLTNLILGEVGGTNSSLNFNVGDLSTPGDNLTTDRLSLLAGGTLGLFAGNTVTFVVSDTGLNASQQYVLAEAASGGFLSGPVGIANYVLNPVPGFTGSSLSASTNNQIILTTGTLITGNSYFTGITDNTWNSNVDNWSNNKAGTVSALGIPGQGTDVIFRADNAISLALNTTLEQNIRVNSLTFEASSDLANTPSSIVIAAGAVASNRLEVTPQLATDGVSIGAGGTGNVTISAPFRVGANQTWNVDDATSRLLLSGGVQGTGFDVTKTGDGKVTLSAAADGTFNLANTTDLNVNDGTLEITNVNALGSVANANLARVAVNSAGAFYYNGAAGTVANNMTLSGGLLSAGGATQTYSGAIYVAGNSTINMRDLNAVATNAMSRAINVTGPINGSGRLTVDSNDTLTGSNAIGTSLTVSGNNTDWSGGVEMVRGTVISTTPTSLGTGSHTFAGLSATLTANASLQGGRMILRGTDGTSGSYTNGLHYNSGTIGEYQIDNVGGLTSNFTVNQNGTLDLGTTGGNGTGAIARLFLADVASSLNFSGGVVLNGNSSLSVAGGDADSLVTIAGTGISEAGGARRLALNDEAGSWNVTSSRIAINAAGTYSGGTTLNEGTLILGNKDALGTGDLTITNASTVQAGVNLSAGGNGPLANALNLGGALTVSGNNSLTIAQATTLISGGNRTVTNSIATTGGVLTLDGPVYLSSNGTATTLTVAGTGNTVISGVVSNSNALGGNGSLTKTGNGRLSLTNTNNYTGTTTQFGSGTQGVIAASATDALGTGPVILAFNTGATTGQLQLDGNITLGNREISTTGLGSDGNVNGIIRSVFGSNVISGNLSLNSGGGDSTYRADAGSTLNINGFVGSVSGTLRNANLVGDGDFIFNGEIRDSNNAIPLVGDKINLNSSTTGTTTLSAVNTYTGTTTVTNGVLRTTLNNALPSTTAVIVNAGNATAILDLNGNSNTLVSLTFGGASGVATSVNQVDTGAGVLTLAGNVSVNPTGNFATAPSISGNLNLGTNSPTFNVVDSAGSAVDLNVNAAISGTVGLIKTGNGTLSLNGSTANIYSGVTVVNQGTLVLNKSSGVNAIAGNGTLSKVNPQVVINGGTLVLAANEQINDSVFVRVNGGKLDFNGKAETLYNLDVVNGEVNYSGNILIEDPTWSGGSNTISSTTTFGFLDISGGNNIVTGSSNGVGGPGTFTIGSSTVSGPLNFTGANTSPTLNLESDNTAPGTLKFRAGATIDLNFTGTGTSSGLIASTGFGTKTGQFDLNGSTRNFNIDNALSVFDMTIAAKIIDTLGSSGINKNGTGTLVLAGDNTYAGSTSVNDGVLIINGSTATGAVSVAPIASLSGIGIIGGAGTISGNLSPGNGPTVGALSFGSSLALNASSTFTWQLLSNTDASSDRGVAGSGYDSVNTVGQLTIAPSAISTLVFNSPGSTVDFTNPFWTLDHSWSVFKGSLTTFGVFGAVNPTKDAANNPLPVSGSFGWAVVGNDVVLNYTAVPEPTSLLLLTFGLVGFGLRRSRLRTIDGCS